MTTPDDQKQVGQLRVCPNADAWLKAGVQLFADAAKQAIAERGAFFVALSGGSTPRELHTWLSGQAAPAAETGADSIDWTRVHAFFGDERYVPHDDPDSNYRMARESLLEHVPTPASQIFPMPTDAAEPSQAAARYEQQIRQQGPAANDAGIPRFDLILLGLGPDGHTASLFPHTAALAERQRWIAANFVEKLDAWRLTFTVPLLCAARNVIFLVRGSGKAEKLQRLIQGPHDPDEIPSQLVQPDEGVLIYLADADAAAGL